MAATFDITGQRPTTMLDANGSVVQGMEVTFTTKPSHIVGRAQIPLSAYTADEVTKVVGAAADTLEAIQKL